MSDNKILTLHLKIQTQNRNHSYICYLISNPPQQIIFTSLESFSFVWYVIPLLKTGALASTCNLFLQVDDEKTCKKLVYACLMVSIGHNTHPVTASSGLYQSPGPPPLGNTWGLVPALCHGNQNGQQSWSIFLSSFCLLLPWQPLGQYRASSCPMAASSGFRSSPGHAALGNAVCIAPAHCHGHQNGQQRRCICLLSSILCLTLLIAKSPCYGPLKLMPICKINLIRLLSLFV